MPSLSVFWSSVRRAASHADGSSDGFDTRNPDDTSSDRKTAVGYTVGAGAETFVANNITARLEYRYTDYGHKDFDLDSGNISRGYDEHSVKVGIGYKF